MKYAVETFSLTKIFSDWWGRDKVYAVEDLDLQIHYNEVFGLLGPNGSGKTTTLKMLLGLLHPSKGKAAVLGGDATNPGISARIGFMPEESYLYRYLNARETLDFYGRLFKLPAKIRKMRIETLLEMVGLKAVANRPVGTFSKGMARRIGLAQALINDPDLLILDEPTTGLDPIGTRQIKDLILQLAKRGKTILLCSHLLADVEDVCDRIAILYGGKIRSEGKVKELLQQTDKKEIITGNISENALEKIRQILYAENADFAVNSPMDKLETFFIRTVNAAQQQAMPTSGAFSTTQIGDFLAEKSAAESILDKLVAAPVSKQSTSQKPPVTEKAAPFETSPQMPDENLLSKLTRPVKPAKPKPVAEPKPVEQKTSTRKEEQIRENILDQLTGRENQKTSENQKTEKPKGDSGDA